MDGFRYTSGKFTITGLGDLEFRMQERPYKHLSSSRGRTGLLGYISVISANKTDGSNHK